MTPFLGFRHLKAAPLLFLAVVGGTIAIADCWMRNRLARKADRARRQGEPQPATLPHVPRFEVRGLK